MEEELGRICNSFTHEEVKKLANCHFKEITSWIGQEIAQGSLKDEGVFAHKDLSHRQQGKNRMIEDQDKFENKRGKNNKI